MSAIRWIDVLGGLGLILFSLRFLTSVLQRSIARRFRSILERTLDAPWKDFLSGAGVTAVVQASSITILTAMGLVGASLISFEQGYFIMLGATVGTTVKAWFFAVNIDQYGPAIIGICSLWRWFVRRPLYRELLDATLAVGFIFFGLDLLANGLLPVTQNSLFIGMLQQFNGMGLAQQFQGVLLGCVLCMATQSSSALVFLIMHLTAQSELSFAAGTSLILGANIGTTATALVASLEHGPPVRRLALSHLLVKALGVCVTVFFFPFFLQAVGLLVPGTDTGPGAVTRLAGAHTLFNVLNAATFAALSGLMLRVLRHLVPSQAGPVSIALPAIVRRLLTRTPQRALEEAQTQMVRIVQHTKALTDNCFQVLQEGQGEGGKLSGARFDKDFTDFKESLHDLLLRLSRNRLSADLNRRVRWLLHFLGRCEDLQVQALSLHGHLQAGSRHHYHYIATKFRAELAAFQKSFDALWLRVHFHRASVPEELSALTDSVRRLEEGYFDMLLDYQDLTQEDLSWTWDVLQDLRHMSDRLLALCTAAVPLEDTPPVNTLTVPAPSVEAAEAG